MNQAKVSVIICVYNGEAHLQQAISSVLEQSYRDFELIVVDDGSTDSTQSIVSACAEMDGRIKVIRNESNLGVEKSRNIGFYASAGEYIATLDADDISLPHRLEKQVGFLDENPGVGAVGSDVELINNAGCKIGSNHLPPDHARLKALLLLDNFTHNSTLMVRRHLVEHIGGYSDKLRCVEDYDFWWKISEKSEIRNLSTVCVQRRMEDSGRYSLSNRQIQLENAYKLSLSFIRASISSSNEEIDSSSYRKLWWTLHRLLDRASYQEFWVDKEKEDAHLTTADLSNLHSLFEFLRSFPGASSVWGDHMRNTSYDLIRKGEIFIGLNLLWISVSFLGSSPFSMKRVV